MVLEKGKGNACKMNQENKKSLTNMNILCQIDPGNRDEKIKSAKKMVYFIENLFRIFEILKNEFSFESIKKRKLEEIQKERIIHNPHLMNHFHPH